MNSISIEQVIASAKLTLRLQDSSDADNFLLLQIRYALSTIGSLDSFSKCRATIDIIDGTACLPKNFYKLLALRYTAFNNNGTQNSINPIFSGGLYVDQSFLYQQGCNDGIPNVNKAYIGSFQIVGDKIVLNSATYATQVTIAYMGYYVDENGDPVINEQMEQALSSFACYRYALSFPEAYSPLQIGEWKKDWIAQATMVKGKAAARNFQNDKKEVMAITNSLVSNKNYFPI